MRELQTPNERDDDAAPATPAPDHWSGSKHVVQVRPHVWNWLAPRVGAGAVLEIGPGLRPTAPVATSTFIDASTHALRSLAARGATTAAVEGALPFSDDSFDAVLAFEVIEHVEDDTGLLGEMARVSRPGGVLILSTPVHATLWSPLDEACGHIRRDEPPTLFEKATDGRLRDRWLFVDPRTLPTPHGYPGPGPSIESPALDRVRPGAGVPDPCRCTTDVREGEVAASGRARAGGCG